MKLAGRALTNERVVAGPGRSARIDYLTRGEAERLFRAIPRGAIRDRLLFDLAYRYGLRRGEAVALRMDHISTKSVWIDRLKGGVSGEYPVHPQTRALLARYLGSAERRGSPYLFPSPADAARPLSASTVYLRFRQYARRAGLPDRLQHPHVLRHSIAVHLMNAGWDASDVQDWLGHRDIQSTMVYAVVTTRRRLRNFTRTLRSREIARS